MSFQYVIVPADISQRIRVCSRAERPSLKELQEAVGGGYIEGVHAPETRLHPEMELYVDEEGLLKELPYNLRGTSLASDYGNVVRLFGDVVAIGEVDEEGDNTSLTANQLSALKLMDEAAAQHYGS